mmetsp:Transcript_29868/g.97272  ORF Transcript_29868/g.97272 Transcript_29868/m.97272 type:complete len:219 (-) Transcript_29868:1008-1664(-)
MDALRRQRVALAKDGVLPRDARSRAPSTPEPAPHPRPHGLRRRERLSDRQPRRLSLIHHLHDGALLRRLQPPPAHGGRQPQSVPLWQLRGEPPRRDASGRHRRGAPRRDPRRRAAQKGEARGDGDARVAPEPANGAHRWLSHDDKLRHFSSSSLVFIALPLRRKCGERRLSFANFHPSKSSSELGRNGTPLASSTFKEPSLRLTLPACYQRPQHTKQG